MNTRRSAPVLEIVLIVVIALCFLVIATANYRRQQAAIPYANSYSTFDKSGGGYAAWFEMLRREGVRVGRFERRPAYLDETVDTAIVSPSLFELEERAQRSGSTIGQLSDVDFQALHDWVRRGGHLVWVTDGQTDASIMHMPELATDGPIHDGAVTVMPSPVTAGVDQVYGSSRLRVRFGSGPNAAPLLADDTGAVVAQYPLGKGTVTIVTDQSLFSNARIGKADNARLAYNLATAGAGPHGQVVFEEWVHGFASGDSWWTILPLPMRAALVLVALAGLVLLIGSALRFGPTAQPELEPERTSAEYVASMAELLGRGRAARKALRDLADFCTRDIAASLSLPESAPLALLISRLRATQRENGSAGRSDAAALLELDRLRAYEQPTNDELVRAAQLTALLRKEYSRHGRLGFNRRGSPAKRSA